MQTLKFKTSINCGNCVRSISGFLNELEGIQWEVDTDNPNKILTVSGAQLNKKTIIETVESAGFDIEALEG